MAFAQSRAVRLGITYVSVIVIYMNISCIPPLTLTIIKEVEIAHFQAGLLMTVYTVAYCISNVFAGVLADKVGPERVMSAGLAISYISTYVFASTSQLSIMLLCRALIGVGAASMTSPCILYILSNLPPEKGSLGVSGHLSSVTLGSGAVLLITPIVVRVYPWRSLLNLYALLGFVTLIFFCLFNRGNLLRFEQLLHSSHSVLSFRRNILSFPLILLSMILFAAFFLIGGTMTWLAPWLEEKCMFSPVRTGLGSMAFALTGIPSSIFGGYMSGKVKNIVPLSMIGMLLSASIVSFGWLEANTYFIPVIIVAILARWGSFMSFGPLISIIPRLVSSDSRGLAIGFVNFTFMSGGFLSSLLGGLIIEYTGGYKLIWILFSAILVFSALVLHPLLNKSMKNMETGS
jgi:predicted MFS family arabinose efflux permease